MKKVIEISVAKRKAVTKAAEIEEAYKQREEQILEYQRRNPFSYLEWYSAWKSGWLRQHGLGIHCFPSPILHHKDLWHSSKSPYFLSWRKESREKQKEFIESRRKK